MGKSEHLRSDQPEGPGDEDGEEGQWRQDRDDLEVRFQVGQPAPPLVTTRLGSTSQPLSHRRSVRDLRLPLRRAAKWQAAFGFSAMGALCTAVVGNRGWLRDSVWRNGAS